MQKSMLKTMFVGMTAVVLSASAMAQTTGAAKSPSGTTADDIICKMSDTCDSADTRNAADKLDKPNERVFSLQKQSANSAPSQPTTYAKKPAVSSAPSPKKAVAVAPARSQPSVARAAKAHNVEMKVQFLRGSAQLTPEASSELDVYVSALQSSQLTNMKFVVEGHTDSTGTRAQNVALSQQRAQSVVDYLVAAGISKDRLEARGFGPDRPIAGVSRRAAANRRVELTRAN